MARVQVAQVTISVVFEDGKIDLTQKHDFDTRTSIMKAGLSPEQLRTLEAVEQNINRQLAAYYNFILDPSKRVILGAGMRKGNPPPPARKGVTLEIPPIQIDPTKG
jgi:hypothetical protein